MIQVPEVGKSAKQEQVMESQCAPGVRLDVDEDFRGWGEGFESGDQ